MTTHLLRKARVEFLQEDTRKVFGKFVQSAFGKQVIIKKILVENFNYVQFEIPTYKIIKLHLRANFLYF